MYSLWEVFSHLFSGIKKWFRRSFLSYRTWFDLHHGGTARWSSAYSGCIWRERSTENGPNTAQAMSKKNLETNANWIVLHVKIINYNADQRARWFISGLHRNKSVLNRWNIYINVHILTYKIRSTKETNIWHIILPII